jgi:hypothetical protein
MMHVRKRQPNTSCMVERASTHIATARYPTRPRRWMARENIQVPTRMPTAPLRSDQLMIAAARCLCVTSSISLSVQVPKVGFGSRTGLAKWVQPHRQRYTAFEAVAQGFPITWSSPTTQEEQFLGTVIVGNASRLESMNRHSYKPDAE